MSESDNENTCIETVLPITLPKEQLRLYLGGIRNRLHRERLRLLHTADVLKQEIAAFDELLAELTTE